MREGILFGLGNGLCIGIGQVLMSYAYTQSTIMQLPINLYGFLAIFIYAVGALAYIKATQLEPVSKIFPLNALSYVWVALGGIFLLSDTAGVAKIIAIGLITVGSIMVSA